jgi:hypothetical protein
MRERRAPQAVRRLASGAAKYEKNIAASALHTSENACFTEDLTAMPHKALPEKQ